MTRLLRDSTLTGEQVAEVLDGAGLVPFPDPYVEGFQWDENGRLVYPGIEDKVTTCRHNERPEHCMLFELSLKLLCID